MEIVIEGWRVGVEDWREAQRLPADQLPALSEEQRKVARKLGIAEEAYARSAYAGRRTQDRLMEKTKRLAEILPQQLQAQHPRAILRRIRLVSLEHRYYIEMAEGDRNFRVQLEEELVDDLLERGSAAAGREMEQILDRILIGTAA